MENQLLEKLSGIESLVTRFTIKEVLSFNEACELLNLSSSYLYKLTHKQQIPHYKPNGKKLYFKRSELEAWLLKNRVKPLEEIEQDAINYVTKKKGV